MACNEPVVPGSRARSCAADAGSPSAACCRSPAPRRYRSRRCGRCAARSSSSSRRTRRSCAGRTGRSHDAAGPGFTAGRDRHQDRQDAEGRQGEGDDTRGRCASDGDGVMSAMRSSKPSLPRSRQAIGACVRVMLRPTTTDSLVLGNDGAVLASLSPRRRPGPNFSSAALGPGLRRDDSGPGMGVVVRGTLVQPATLVSRVPGNDGALLVLLLPRRRPGPNGWCAALGPGLRRDDSGPGMGVVVRGTLVQPATLVSRVPGNDGALLVLLSPRRRPGPNGWCAALGPGLRRDDSGPGMGVVVRGTLVHSTTPGSRVRGNDGAALASLSPRRRPGPNPSPAPVPGPRRDASEARASAECRHAAARAARPNREDSPAG